MPNQFFKYFLIAVVVLFARPVIAQKDSLTAIRSRGVDMLTEIKEIVKERYYDPTHRGIDIEKKYLEAREEIKKAERNGHVYSIIAQFLLDFNDSHLFFIPPDRVQSVDYGFQLKMVGDKCFVGVVKKGSDAEKQGVKVGDQVYALETFEPTRESLWKLIYFYYRLSPQPAIRLTIQNSDSNLKQYTIQATIKTRKQQREEYEEEQKKEKEKNKGKSKAEKKAEGEAYECKTPENDLAVCRLETFSIPEKEVDRMMEVVGDRKAMVLDLRGNGGGYVKTLNHLLGYFFDQEVKIGTSKMRKSEHEEIAKSHGARVFKGKLTVLIDSQSGSAAEVFAKVIQLEKRGTVIGDRSAGAVMTSRRVTGAHQRRTASMDTASLTLFGISITIADLIMRDGKSLEIIGVTPDIFSLPSGEDMLKKRDVTLSKAAETLGFSLDPAAAGNLFLPREEKTSIDDEGGAETGSSISQILQ